jgi:hypothetical protein
LTALPLNGIARYSDASRNRKGAVVLKGQPQSARSLIVFYLNAHILQLHQLARLSGEPLRSGFIDDAREIQRILKKIESGEVLVVEGARVT